MRSWVDSSRGHECCSFPGSSWLGWGGGGCTAWSAGCGVCMVCMARQSVRVAGETPEPADHAQIERLLSQAAEALEREPAREQRRGCRVCCNSESYWIDCKCNWKKGLIPRCKNMAGGFGYKHFLFLSWSPHFEFTENILAYILTQSGFWVEKPFDPFWEAHFREGRRQSSPLFIFLLVLWCTLYITG